MVLETFRLTNDFTWDRANGIIFDDVIVNQGDAGGRKMRVQVVNRGAVENLTGAGLNLAWKAPNGKGLDKFTAVNAAQGIFEISFTKGMLANVGRINASLQLILPSGGGIVESRPFVISNQASVVDQDSAQSTDSWTALETALVNAENLEANYTPKLFSLEQELAQTELEAKRKRELEDLSPTVLAAIEGGDGTNFNLLSEPQNYSVTPIKTNFFILSKNLFNVNGAVVGFVNWLTGSIDQSANFRATPNFIPIKQGVGLAFHPKLGSDYQVRFAYYTEPNKESFISGEAFDIDGQPTIPETARYFRVSCDKRVADRFQVEYGTTPTYYEPFYEDFDTDTIRDGGLEAKKIKPKSIDVPQLSVMEYAEDELKPYETIPLSAYHNPANDGKIIDGTGKIVSSQYTTAYTVLNKVPVREKTTYSAIFRTAVTYRDNAFGNFYDNAELTSKNFTTAEGVTHVVLSVPIAQLATLTLTRLSPMDSERGIIIPRLQIPNSGEGRFKGEKTGMFGDSITANYPEIENVLKQRLGLDTINFAIGGAKMAERGGVPETTGGGHTANSGLRIAEAIITNDFSAQREYTQAHYTGSTLVKIMDTIDRIEATDFTKLKYATVQFGANDYLQSIPIGTIDGDRHTYMGAYRLFLETLENAFPNIRFLIVSTPITFNAQPSVHTIEDYVVASEQVAKHFNYPFINNYHSAGVNDTNRLQFFNPNDGVHPNPNGGKHYGNRIANGFEINY